MNGHSNILLIPTFLVPFEEAITTVQAVIIQLLTAPTTLRPMPTTATVLGAYFIKSSSESCVAIHQNGLEQRIKYINCIDKIHISIVKTRKYVFYFWDWN